MASVQGVWTYTKYGGGTFLSLCIDLYISIVRVSLTAVPIAGCLGIFVVAQTMCGRDWDKVLPVPDGDCSKAR